MLKVHGKGGHGLVVADAWITEFPNSSCQFSDDAEGTRPGPTDDFIVAIGDNRVRQRLGGNINVVHAKAVVAPGTHYGKGIFIAANAVVNPGVVIGDGVIINTGALVDHGCVLGSWCHIAPGAVLCGGVEVGDGAFVGANSVVKEGIRIGEWSVVGCGAAVIRDVPPGETHGGVPARRLIAADPEG